MEGEARKIFTPRKFNGIAEDEAVAMRYRIRVCDPCLILHRTRRLVVVCVHNIFPGRQKLGREIDVYFL
jgi:hypothetical protein